MLYLCATPIGNLEDITLRALRILKECDLIVAEDTRHTRKLLSHFDIHTPLESYNENNHDERISKLLERLKNNETIVCVSDAGTPGISDPGFELARAAIENQIDVSPIPGANAAISALICSGIDSRRFTFVGFLPRKKKSRTDIFDEIRTRQESLIFYEAPHRLKETLEDLFFHLGDREITICRELTKIHEEFIRGKISDMQKKFETSEILGEYVLIVAGYDSSLETAETIDQNPVDVYEKFLADGLDKKSAIRETAKIFNVSRRDIYQLILKEINE